MIDLSAITPSPDPQVAKYLAAERWLARCERRLDALHLRPGSRILDIGTGCGYFPFVCRARGHEVVALDHPDRDPMYRAVTEALDIDVIDHPVTALRPLPDMGIFDAITAYMVTFNGHIVPPLWGVAEWMHFLDDALARLRPGGVLVLELNREPDGRCYTTEIEALFISRDASFTGHWPHRTKRGGHRVAIRR